MLLKTNLVFFSFFVFKRTGSVKKENITSHLLLKLLLPFFARECFLNAKTYMLLSNPKKIYITFRLTKRKQSPKTGCTSQPQILVSNVKSLNFLKILKQLKNG